MASNTKPTYHLRFDSAVAVCGAVALYPHRAVVRMDLFHVQARKYNTKVCSVCRNYLSKYLKERLVS